jgi:hypothetical protein
MKTKQKLEKKAKKRNKLKFCYNMRLQVKAAQKRTKRRKKLIHNL